MGCARVEAEQEPGPSTTTALHVTTQNVVSKPNNRVPACLVRQDLVRATAHATCEAPPRTAWRTLSESQLFHMLHKESGNPCTPSCACAQAPRSESTHLRRTHTSIAYPPVSLTTSPGDNASPLSFHRDIVIHPVSSATVHLCTAFPPFVCAT